jgi:hypothetical protein
MAMTKVRFGGEGGKGKVRKSKVSLFLILLLPKAKSKRNSLKAQGECDYAPVPYYPSPSEFR